MNNQLVKQERGLVSLSLIDQRAIEILPAPERKFVELALQPKVNEAAPLDVVTQFIALLTTAYTRAGQQADTGTLAIYADEFYNSLLEKYPRVSIAEVKEALKNGVYGDYGKYFGLNPVTFIQWVKSYLQAEERKEAHRNFENKQFLLSDQPVMFTQAQKDKEDKDFANYLYKQYKARQLRNVFFPVTVYETLLRFNVIAYTTQKKLLFSRAAKRIRCKELFLEQRGNLNNGLDIRAASIGELINQHAKGTEPLEEKEAVKNVARKIAVLYYFANCNVNKKKAIF